MSNPTRKSDDQTERLFDLLEEELLNASEKDVDEICREWGLDPRNAAGEVDAAFKDAFKSLSKSKLEDARQAREAELAKLSSVPTLITSRDELLAAVQARLAEIEPGQMTVQHRDFSEYSESALRTMLQQLSALKD